MWYWFVIYFVLIVIIVAILLATWHFRSQIKDKFNRSN